MKTTKEDLEKQAELIKNFGESCMALLSNGVDFKITEDTSNALIIEYLDHESGTHLGELNYARFLRSITGQVIVENAIDSDIYSAGSEGKTQITYANGNVTSIKTKSS